MPTSYYLGPRQPRFAPSVWTDIGMASNSGLFDETQWVERKKDIPPTSGPADLELARDLASLSVDGGVLIVGIRDSQKGVLGMVTGSVETDLADRIAQVARGRVSPPLHVMIDRFAHPTEPTRAVLMGDGPRVGRCSAHGRRLVLGPQRERQVQAQRRRCAAPAR